MAPCLRQSLVQLGKTHFDVSVEFFNHLVLQEFYSKISVNDKKLSVKKLQKHKDPNVNSKSISVHSPPPSQSSF